MVEQLTFDFPSFLLWCCFSAVIVSVTVISGVGHKKAVFLWTIAGIVTCLIKVYLIQQLPQWADYPLDAIKFQIHAEALRLHWLDLPVEAETYYLHGYVNSWQIRYGPYWLPDSDISYTGVLGTSNFLYTLLLAIWRYTSESYVPWATMTNIVMAGALPAMTYVIARNLDASRRTSQIAAVLIMLAPSIAVHASWLIKGSLVCFLTMICILNLQNLRHHNPWPYAILFGIALGLLGMTRYVVFLAVTGVSFLLIFKYVWQKCSKNIATLSLGLFIAAIVWTFTYSLPNSISIEDIHYNILATLQGGINTLKVSRSHTQQEVDALISTDESVIRWHERLHTQPVRTVATVFSRTLFAPYPWVAFTQGLTWNNQMELYYMGTLMLMLFWPFIIFGIILELKKRKTNGVILIILLVQICIAYIIFYGEWSTRQRVFMLPVLYAFTAIAFDHLFMQYNFILSVIKKHLSWLLPSTLAKR